MRHVWRFTMTEPKRIGLIWVILAALLAVIVVFDVAYASGTDIEQEVNIEGSPVSMLG